MIEKEFKKWLTDCVNRNLYEMSDLEDALLYEDLAFSMFENFQYESSTFLKDQVHDLVKDVLDKVKTEND